MISSSLILATDLGVGLSCAVTAVIVVVVKLARAAAQSARQARVAPYRDAVLEIAADGDEDDTVSAAAEALLNFGNSAVPAVLLALSADDPTQRAVGRFAGHRQAPEGAAGGQRGIPQPARRGAGSPTRQAAGRGTREPPVSVGWLLGDLRHVVGAVLHWMAIPVVVYFLLVNSSYLALAGINASAEGLVAIVDADSILDPDALLVVTKPFADDPVRVVATGGMVRVANGCSVVAGRVTSDWLTLRLPQRQWPRLGAVSGSYVLGGSSRRCPRWMRHRTSWPWRLPSVPACRT